MLSRDARSTREPLYIGMPRSVQEESRTPAVPIADGRDAGIKVSETRHPSPREAGKFGSPIGKSVSLPVRQLVLDKYNSRRHVLPRRVGHRLDRQNRPNRCPLMHALRVLRNRMRQGGHRLREVPSSDFCAEGKGSI